MIRTLFTSAVLSSTLLAGAVFAAPPAPQDGSAPVGMHEHHRGPEGFGHGGPGFGPHHGPHGSFFLAGLDLTDAQREQIWKLHYADEPAMHQNFETLMKSRKALHELTLSADYSDAKAQQLVQQQTQAQANLELSRIKTQRAVYALLTPDQQQKVQARINERAEHKGPGGWGQRAENDSPVAPDDIAED